VIEKRRKRVAAPKLPFLHVFVSPPKFFCSLFVERGFQPPVGVGIVRRERGEKTNRE